MNMIRLCRFLLGIQLFLILLLGALALLRDFHLSEVSAAGRVIRYTAETIINTQELIKLELGKSEEDHAQIERLRTDISTTLDDLFKGNVQRDISCIHDRVFREELSRLYMQWKKLECMAEVCRKNPVTGIQLFMLSIEYYDQSKMTLASAENYASRMTRLIELEKVAGAVLLCLIASIVFVLLYFNMGEARHALKK